MRKTTNKGRGESPFPMEDETMKKIPMFLYHVTATHNTLNKVLRFDLEANCARSAALAVTEYLHNLGWEKGEYTAHLEWEVKP